jgi:hypothetical protein
MKILFTAMALMFAAPMMSVSANDHGEGKTVKCKCGCEESKPCECGEKCPSKDKHKK